MDNCQLKYTDYDIVFQEIPNEVTLAINLSRCPNRCEGCHSAYLMNDVGEKLTLEVIDSLYEKYGSSITCICFMGGDQNIEELLNFLTICKEYNLKTCLYTGADEIEFPYFFNLLDYIKKQCKMKLVYS